nr:uncharacterized protein LOC109160869 [Ipomoea batatas]
MSSSGGRRQEGWRGYGSSAGGAVRCRGGSPSVVAPTETGRRRSNRIAFALLPKNYISNSSCSSDEDFKTAPRTLVGTEQGGQRIAIATDLDGQSRGGGDTINNKIKVRGIAKPLISIMRDDVAAVFGFPCGTITITECDTQIGNPLLSEWKEELRQPKRKVTVTTLCSELLTHHNGGIWFKCHSSIVVLSNMVESEHNGYVNQKIVHMFGDTTGITKLDWCGVDFKAVETEGGTGDFSWGFRLGHLDTPLHLSDIHVQQMALSGDGGENETHYATLAVEHTHQGNNSKPSKSTFYAPPSPLELPDEYEDFHRRILALPQLQSSAAMTTVAAIQHQIVGEQRDDTHSNAESDSSGARSVKANGRAGSGGENAGCEGKRPLAPPRTCPYHG